MKVTVDRDLCGDHGQCVLAAPEVFDFDDDGHLVYDENASAAHRDDVEVAADACPVQAILISDDD